MYSAIHINTRWKILDSRQMKNRHTTKTKHNPEKANNAKYSRTKLAWFSRLIRRSARKRGGLILQSSRTHTGHVLTVLTTVFDLVLRCQVSWCCDSWLLCSPISRPVQLSKPAPALLSQNFVGNVFAQSAVILFVSIQSVELDFNLDIGQQELLLFNIHDDFYSECLFTIILAWTVFFY